MKLFFFLSLAMLIEARILFPNPIIQVEEKVVTEIRQIDNPAKPLFVNPTLQLKKDWEVGGEDPGFIFQSPSALDADKNGRIYVTDMLETDVKVFSSSGELLFSFGRKGQGPSEFQSPQSITILPDNKILVIDYRPVTNKFIFFDSLGNFIEEFTDNLRESTITNPTREQMPLLARWVYVSRLFSDQRVLLFTNAPEGRVDKAHSIWMYDLVSREGKRIVYRQKVDPYRSRAPKQNDRMFLNTQWCSDKLGNIYFFEDAYSYKIHIYDSSGVLKQIITKEFTLPLRTKEDYERRKKMAQEEFFNKLKRRGINITWEELKVKPILYNPHRNARSMFCDGDNRLWVVTNEPAIDENSEGFFSGLFDKTMGEFAEKPTVLSFDVFSSEGHYLMKIPFDAKRPHSFVYKDGLLYFIDRKEDGFPWLCKYKIVKKQSVE